MKRDILLIISLKLLGYSLSIMPNCLLKEKLYETVYLYVKNGVEK